MFGQEGWWNGVGGYAQGCILVRLYPSSGASLSGASSPSSGASLGGEGDVSCSR